MRIDTACFEGFVNMMNKDDWNLTNNSFEVGTNGFITCWHFSKVEMLAEVYCKAWEDAARCYKSFGR